MKTSKNKNLNKVPNKNSVELKKSENESKYSSISILNLNEEIKKNKSLLNNTDYLKSLIEEIKKSKLITSNDKSKSDYKALFALLKWAASNNKENLFQAILALDSFAQEFTHLDNEVDLKIILQQWATPQTLNFLLSFAVFLKQQKTDINKFIILGNDWLSLILENLLTSKDKELIAKSLQFIFRQDNQAILNPIASPEFNKFLFYIPLEELKKILDSQTCLLIEASCLLHNLGLILGVAEGHNATYFRGFVYNYLDEYYKNAGLSKDEQKILQSVADEIDKVNNWREDQKKLNAFPFVISNTKHVSYYYINLKDRKVTVCDGGVGVKYSEETKQLIPNSKKSEGKKNLSSYGITQIKFSDKIDEFKKKLNTLIKEKIDLQSAEDLNATYLLTLKEDPQESSNCTYKSFALLIEYLWAEKSKGEKSITELLNSEENNPYKKFETWMIDQLIKKINGLFDEMNYNIIGPIGFEVFLKSLIDNFLSRVIFSPEKSDKAFSLLLRLMPIFPKDLHCHLWTVQVLQNDKPITFIQKVLQHFCSALNKKDISNDLQLKVIKFFNDTFTYKDFELLKEWAKIDSKFIHQLVENENFPSVNDYLFSKKIKFQEVSINNEDEFNLELNSEDQINQTKNKKNEDKKDEETYILLV